MKHHIIVKYKPEITAEEKQKLIPEIQALFDHTREIPGVHKIELFPNCVDRSNRYDLMIRMDMDQEALPAYDSCQWHHEWKDNYGHLLEKKCIFDCE